MYINKPETITSILMVTRHFFYALLVAVIFCGCGTDSKTLEQRGVGTTAPGLPSFTTGGEGKFAL